jgi:hypothetical protein
MHGAKPQWSHAPRAQRHRLHRRLQRLPRLVHSALPLPLLSLALLLLLAAAGRLLRTARGLCGRRHGLHCILHRGVDASAC